MNVDEVLGLYNYWIVIFLMMTGFYIVIARSNLIKTVIGLNIFQISVILLYVTMGKVAGGTAPIVPPALVQHGHAEHAHDDHGRDQHGHGDHSGEHGHDEGDPHHDTAGEHDAAADHEGNAHHENAEHHSHAPGDDEQSVAGVKVVTELNSSIEPTDLVYSNPLPSVLMLTAIVVGVATTALALALIVRIREDYGTIHEDEILELDRAA